VRAFAKINLTLEVLNKRTDGFHNIRTVFQTVSLADTLDFEYQPGRTTGIELRSSVDIPDNLVLRAAKAFMERTNASGKLQIRLEKRIPMGGGLGGGSTDAAAVLLALPVLAGRVLPMEALLEIAAGLGSDVPFFLTAGTALGLGRGTELYPLAEPAQSPAMLVFPDVHVSTAQAYNALERSLTPAGASTKINTSQSLALAIEEELVAEGWSQYCVNDFEAVVFNQHPRLAAIKRKLMKSGARPALMSGSGSALFGFFQDQEALARALPVFASEKTFVVKLVNRARYRSLWWRWLGEHIDRKTWPPQSRYAR
jgi:4-diphosphocytidyl-2-C-methyl-D-erythritol kinase